MVCTVLLCASCSIGMVLADPVFVDGVRVGLHELRTRVVFDLSGPVDYRALTLSDPERVVLDVSEATLRADLPEGLFAGTAVSRVRSADRDGGTLRLVLDLAEPGLEVTRFVLGPSADAERGHRLVIDLTAPAIAQSGDTAKHATAAQPPESSGAAQYEALPAVSPGGPPVGTEAQLQEAAQSHDTETPVDERAEATELESFFDFEDSEAGDTRLSGYFETSAAYTYAEPEHWSKLRARLELALSGKLSGNVRYKLAARLDGDAAYVVEDDFYPSAVRDDQRLEAQIREFYLDFGGGPWAHRVGRQHIVWGEMVGLFLADVVSARDLREFYLQDFEAMRIPQWAWNTQYFAGDSTLELVYVPVPSVDKVGEPGADFFPFALPPGTPLRSERPDRELGNYNWGIRGSTLKAGWSLSAYYYDSFSVAPTLEFDGEDAVLRYDPIEQVGATFSKDFGGFVFKGEAVFTQDRRFQSADIAEPSALFTSDALDWVVGAMIPVGDFRWDFQLYGRQTYDYDPRMGFDESEFGVTALMNYRYGSRLELELLALAGLNREDYLIRPKLAWRFQRDWRLQLGADVFGGDEIGLFGPYENRDRVYLEVKRWF